MTRYGVYLAVLLTMAALLGAPGRAAAAAGEPDPANRITIYETSGSEQVDRSISIARVFRRGEITGFARAKVDGQEVLTQCDVKNRWPDGSLKFAVISFRIPLLAANGAAVITLVDQADGHNSGFLAQEEMLGRAFDFEGEIEMRGATTQTISARKMLKDGHWRYWLKGPIVTAVIIEDRGPARLYDRDFGDGSKALHPIFEAWFYPAEGAVDLGYTVENTWASSDRTKGMRDLRYGLTLRSGQASPRTRLVEPPFVHIGRSRWHKRFWVGVNPAAVRVDHNAAYLGSTGAIPNYDTAVRVRESLVASTYASWLRAPKGLAEENGALGSYLTELTTTGASPWIGLSNTWDVLYLMTMDDRMREMSFGNADLAGRIPWHFREADSHAGTGRFFDQAGRVDTQGRVVSVNARRTVSLWDLGPGSDCGEAYRRDRISVERITDAGWQTSRDHMPDTAYLPYLLSGRYYYLEELQYLAAFVVAHKIGCYDDSPGGGYHRQGHNGFLHDTQVRGDAWGFRTLSYAAFLSPQGTPEQDYFDDKLRNNIAAWEGDHDVPLSDPAKEAQWSWAAKHTRDPRGPSPLGLWRDRGPRFVEAPVVQDGQVQGGASGWEEHFLLSALGMARGFGYPTDGLLKFMAKLRLNLLLNPEANRHLIEAYRWPASLTATGNWISSYASFGQHFTIAPTEWESVGSADHDYGLIALAAVSYLTPYTVDGYSGAAAWALYKRERPGQDHFASDSPKWAILPPAGQVSGGAGSRQTARAVEPGPPGCPPGPMIQVGPTRRLVRPSLAARCAKDGDTIEIDAGAYPKDAAVWRASNLTVRGVGGRAHLKAEGANAEGKAIWVIKGKNTTVENIEFSEAMVPDGNGAGIRLEGPNLTVRRSYFHHNENGILTGANPESHVLIENCEFSDHGSADGRNHNIYIGAIGRFTLRFSYIHHARVGHNVKSRARENFIEYNRIMDEVDGNSSYAVDVPNGGIAYLIGNLVQHGPRAENSTIVSYGAEGLTYPENQLYVVNNTIVNDRSQGGTFIRISGGPSVRLIVNNIFAGPGTVVSVPSDLSHNLVSSQPGLRDRARFDYRLDPRSPAINAGIDPGSANGVRLAPTAQYVHKAGGEPRPTVGAPDIGAYENPARGR
ncbi:MAG TPA: right-handed parallel beta-helix repeat-containing protein [Methylomirabilota bacterium]|nr:right-handed parallel beta-helix repeat-containing protein [Methylomirabilota bacterium]